MIDVDIYGSNGKIKKTVHVGKGSIRKFELMGDDYVLLKFSVSEPVYIAVGDYIDTDLGRFEIAEEQLPAMNVTTGGYDYEMRFDAPYKGWQNKIAMLCYKNTVNGSTAIIRKESEWNLTADISTQVQTAVIDNLNVLGEDYLGEPYAFAVDSSVSSAHKLCSYSSTSIYDAIVSIAETFECEWWVAGNVINFGKAEFGVDSEAVNLTIGDNVATMVSNKSSSEFATRYYVFGSTRNLRNYRKDDRGESVVLGVVTDRLMLPKGTDHIDAYKYDKQGKRIYLSDSSYNDADNVTMPTEEAIESTLVFDDVYPRNTGAASGVTIGREVTDEDENGVKTQSPIYWFKDTSFTFDTKYIIEGETMQVRFESGLLNGMTFDVAFNPDGASLKLDDGSYNPDAQVWEIVRNEDYGRLLPDDVLKPEDGDKVLFNGFDISMVNEQFVSKAETELLDTAIDYIKKKSVDSQTYDCKIFCDVAKNGFTLELGQKCNLVNTAYFKEPRKSRVIGFEIPLDIPYDNPVYVIGESTAYSKLGNLSQKIDELTAKEERYKGGGGSSIYLIRSGDSTTVPSDLNAYSAKRADTQFLRRNKADTAEGAITFEQGLTAIAQNGGGKVAGDGVVESDGTVPESNEVAAYAGIVEYAGSGGGASTLGELDNVVEEADSVDAETDWVLVKLAGSAQWTLKKMSELGNGGTGDSILRLTAEDTDITVAVGYTANIKFNFSSIDSYTQESTGDGTMTVYVNNERKTSQKIKQGDNTVDVQSWISAGENYVTVEVTDVFGAKKKLEFTVTALSISISSTFNAYQIYDSSIPFYYTPFGSFKKTVYFKIDGTVIHREDTSISNRELSYTIPKQSHGSHLLEVYCTTTVEDTVIESNHLIYDLLCIEDGNTATVIACYYGGGDVKQYSSVAVPYMVYRSASITTDVDLYVDGVLVNSLLVDRTRQTWNYRCDKEGEHTFRIQAGSTYKEFTLTVAGSEIDIQPETANLELYLSSINRSNQQKDRDVWEYGGYRANFSGFNWSSDGWVADDNNDTVLRVINGASVEIPMKIFGEDFKSAGKTIEFEFCTRNIMDYSVPVITCINNGKGFQLTAQECMFSAESTSITTQFKEEERVRISFVVDKKSQKRLIYCYINGIVSAVAQYPADDNFAQNVPQSITIGNAKCGIDIYNIRVYSNNLNMYQMLDNYIYDMSDVDRKLLVFRRNQIFDDYGEFLESKINEQLPIMYIIGDLPQYKGDKKNNKIRYVDVNDPAKSFTVETVQNNVQGTSSQYYVRKNYKWKAKTPFIMYDGTEQSKYKFRDECIAVNCFCLKADYAESSSTHNTGFAKLIDATLKKLKFLTPPQEENSVIRTTVDGFPIVVYHQTTEDATPTFLGKYNFNNDKSTSDVYGFTDGDECWEFLNNTSDRCLFLASEFDAVDDDGNPVWLNDFEARYPDLDDPYKDCTHLKALCDWIVSCKGDTDKFKAEVENWFDLDFLLFYYLFTEIFAMVDQRAKNMMFYYCAKDGKWRPIFYDNDTILGLNNEGAIAFSYNVEYHDKIGTQNVYNGEASTLFNLIEQCMYTEVQTLYTNMRSQGYLSYDVVVEFLDEQEAQKWCESIYNYDMKFKYIDPLDDGDASNLFRLQGSREQHRKWWLYNRMRYMDSKYNAGDFKQDYATLRLYTPSDYAGVEPNADFTVIPYSDEYVGVKYGSYFKISRAEKNVPITIVAPDIVFNDTETIIYGASSLLDLGDLSPLYSGTIDVTRCVKLTTLNIGSDAEGYQNTNLTEVSVGANTMLQRINVMNCPNLSNTLDLSRCPNMQEVYCDGTAIRSVSLKAGTPIKVLHLSSEVTNLTFTDITTLTDLSIPSYDNITTIKIENSPSVDELSILNNTLYKDPLKLERLRLTGVNWKLDNSDFLMDLYNNSKTGGGSIYGINEFNENVNDIQLTGDAELKVVYAGDEDKIQSLFPYLNLTYDTVILKFEDPEFEKALMNWFKQTSVGGITKAFAESVTDTKEDGWNNVICKNYDVTSAKGFSKFTNLTKIQGTFNGKTKLTYIEFPPNLVILGDRSFLGAAATHDIIVPNSVETVGSYVFQSTKSSTIIMGQNVKSIGSSIVNTSSALENFVIITATPPTLGSIGWSLPKAFRVYVPSASYDAYKAADIWKNYGISKLEDADADLRAKVNKAYGTNY